MSIITEHEYDLELGFDKNELIDYVINGVLDYLECPYEVEVNVTLVDNDTIHQINKEQRDIDRATDVLSFPMIEYEVPGDFSLVEDDFTCFNPETGELMFGDIVLSLDKVVSQAEEYNHSTRREMAFLIAHSMLHLAGYDHMEYDERAVMEEKQNEIMSKLGINRD